MAIQSLNPFTEEIIKTYQELSDSEIETKLAKAQQAFEAWKHTSFEERASLMLNLAKILQAEADELGKLATLEMGKPYQQSPAEIKKSAWACEFYAHNAQKFLADEHIETEATESYVRFDPLGVIMAVMPWNFPFWQVFRFTAPALMAGNVGILKHASNVPQCALKIEELHLKAGFPEGVFQTLLIGSSKVEKILRDNRVKGASLTGSEYAGSQVAKICGEEIKPVVLELGGSDPFIVFEDVDLEHTLDQAIIGRTQNNGQSCIAAKRFIVEESIYDQFIEGLKLRLEKLNIGDPMMRETDIGPLVNKQAVDDANDLVRRAVDAGAKIEYQRQIDFDKGFFFSPIIISNIDENVPLYKEEAFAPVFSMYKFSSVEQAIKIANDTDFGLGASIWTKDIQRAKILAGNIESGNVYINKIVSSHPHMPFGGIKKSGIGRELSSYGIREFVNIKSVMVG